MMPEGYYRMITPRLVSNDVHSLPPARRRELEEYGNRLSAGKSSARGLDELVGRLIPSQTEHSGDGWW